MQQHGQPQQPNLPTEQLPQQYQQLPNVQQHPNPQNSTVNNQQPQQQHVTQLQQKGQNIQHQQPHPINVEQKIDLNSFPSIEVASAKGNGHVNHDDANIEVNSESDGERADLPKTQSNHQHHMNQYHNQRFAHNNQFHNNYKQKSHMQRQQQLQLQLANMSPEQRDHFLSRQEKVQKITRCSGFMTPKDKDFVTRFQLSQIVTDDPYNEDFYSQVYKVLNSANGENNMNSLAQKYLEQSGHRLGGRSKRADIALQRMQQQVSKAVSVAKERGESTGILTKAGALGKVSFGNGKQPRRQLIIHNQESEQDDKASTKANTKKEIVLPKEFTFSKSARTFQLSIIEKIYNEVLKLESLERENQQYETSQLWKSLHINDVIKTSAGEVMNPFISILSYDKMMKLFDRMFHFFTPEQKLELTSQLFLHLQDLDVIRKGSYQNYSANNYEIPNEVSKKIDLFQIAVLKGLVFYLSESNFSYVLTWLNTLVTSKTILFIVTTKIGLSLITVLISRLELIKQEFGSSISAQELSQWQTVYDQLFQCLEGRLSTCFPPYISHDEARKVTNKDSNDDGSYVWQFLASLTLTGQLNHQRIIVDEVRNEIFGVMAVAKELKSKGELDSASRYLDNLNLFLNAMGLVATEDDISQLNE